MSNKNAFDYILMGLKNHRLSEVRKKEQDEKLKLDANKFNKAFSDKTYTVAKKVIDNVEKLADYDYDDFFVRVNRVIDDKLSSHKDANRKKNAQLRKKIIEDTSKAIKLNKADPGNPYEEKVLNAVNQKIEAIQARHDNRDDKADQGLPTNTDDAVGKAVKKDKKMRLAEKNKQAESVINDYIETKYTKENLAKNSKYYKQKKREKFAKRMSVELEENLIIKKKRSFTRLFKFSIAFKLSFVFILLIITTIVALSFAFYLGIDYVIVLYDLGKLDDIAFFKDILLVLLVIFNFIAILISVSLGTKTSRGLVQPIDEMTNIVKKINANEMDRRIDIKGIHDELRELALTFNEMLDRIESSYAHQNRFTSDASHELRTPIAVIQGYINMLDRWGKADSEILDESIEAIKSESNNMKKLTDKLLLLAKADKGILELDFKPFELNDLISEITRETIMIDSNHKIVNKINDVKTIVADRESLKQAIRIFVDNSVKYTPEGGEIAINSYLNKKNIYIEIADNGIGISKDDMDNIFNRFYRVDSSRAKESGGHGLGLSIAKWIINQHKGNIEVKSELNKGTVITIILSQ